MDDVLAVLQKMRNDYLEKLEAIDASINTIKEYQRYNSSDTKKKSRARKTDAVLDTDPAKGDPEWLKSFGGRGGIRL